jgi:L-rhamnose mutarotase
MTFGIDPGAALALMLLCGAARAAAKESSGKRSRLERYGMVIGIKPEKIPYYKKLHASPWPGVLKKIRECHIRDYSIFLKELEPGKFYLFSYFEYTGSDFAADLAKMAADPTTRKWWRETDPCQEPIPACGPNEWWSRLEEVFHTD